MSINQELSNLQRVIQESTTGWRNVVALREAKGCLASIRSQINSTTDPATEEKTSMLEEYVDILFSERKHLNYPGGQEQVRVNIIGICHDLREGE